MVLRFVSNAEGSTADVWMGRAFFVWTTVFALFNTSIFWCFMADAFRSDQAKRLFGFIGVGGTLGSIVGSAATAALAPKIGAVNLLLVSRGAARAGDLHGRRVSVAGAGRRLAHGVGGRRGDAMTMSDVIGGSVWAGFTQVAAFAVPARDLRLSDSLYDRLDVPVLRSRRTSSAGSTRIARARTAVLAKLELAAQVLTVITQIFFTGRIIRWLGLAVTLALLPAISILGFGALGRMPTFATLAVFTVLRRASNFALTNPAMEVLFTVVPREDKYKAKNIIETFVYRGGDQLGGVDLRGPGRLGLSLARHLVRRRAVRGAFGCSSASGSGKDRPPWPGAGEAKRESCRRARRGRDLTALPRVGMYTKCVRR